MTHLKPNQIGILLENGYNSRQRQSKTALQYLSWLEAKLGRPLRHKLNGGEKEVEVNGRKFLLDAYDPVENRAYEINGCIFHGCPDCTNPTAKAPLEGKHTMEEMYYKTKERQRLIESTGIAVAAVWEHQIRNEIRNSPDYIKIKQKASGWPKADMSAEEKATFLSDHEKHVGIKLDSENVRENPAIRSIAKLQLNSVWGKMGQRPDKIETQILSVNDPLPYGYSL
ncbi:unnamed protein product [Auanema sp. JU1783]|nr:unnamed protein product [Auanema sp. JU1783]